MKYRIFATCAATLTEEWELEIPDAVPEDERKGYALEHLHEGRFICEESSDEQDRDIYHIETLTD